MIYIIIAIAGIITITVINKIKQKKVIKLFKSGNVMVSGMKGQGKDLLFCWVINKRKENYISNVQYSKENKKYKRFEFEPKVWELAGNDFEKLVNGEVKKYTYPYPDGIDYYISDGGIYFPAQYHTLLDKKYKASPMFMALQRHLGDSCTHFNSQKQNRVWDKIREQSDKYIVMRGVWFIPKTKYFRIKLDIYDNEETAEKQLKKPFFGIGKKAREAEHSFETIHGKIKKISFWGKLVYNYDSRRFKKILENEVIDYEN